MKKLVSLVLAIVLALSLSTISFAAAFDPAAIAQQVSDYISAALKKADVTLPDELSPEALQKAVTDALEAAGAFNLTDLDTSKIATMVNDAINKVAADNNIPVDQIKNFLSETGLAKAIAGTYGIGLPPATTKAPVATTTAHATIPATGSATGGIAIFATLSIAAAAAFVCMKKK